MCPYIGRKAMEQGRGYHYVVIGGGIAGVSCSEEVSRLDPAASVCLVSGSPLIKAVTNFTQVSRALEQFDVSERSSAFLSQLCPNVTVKHSTMTAFDSSKKVVYLSDGSSLAYDKLCICTGAQPRVIVKEHPRVLGIRDTESVKEFQKKLASARKIVVVGNGGIATELVYEVSGCEVVWAIKDKAISSTFFDEGAATFFLPHLVTPHHSTSSHPHTSSTTDIAQPVKRSRYTLDQRRPTSTSEQQAGASISPSSKEAPSGVGSGGVESGGTRKEEEEEGQGATAGSGAATTGSALGPDWHSEREMRGGRKDKHYRLVHVEYECEVKGISSPVQEEASGGGGPLSWPLLVELTNGISIGCDLVVSATGVLPNTAALTDKAGSILSVCEDGGVLVDSETRTSVRDVYAAGDVCTVKWETPSPLWFQMRLWSQARQLGSFSGRCMAAHRKNEEREGEEEIIAKDFCFELFAHVTTFFGYKVVLLGRYNAQGLGRDYELLLRMTKGVEYIKVVLQNGRMVGAILIGETDLEETFENLILNQMDLSHFGASLLDPGVDIEDYFD